MGMYEELLIAVTALIVSIVSVLYVALKEGVSLGFRESETTSTRRKEITNTLNEAIRADILSFLEKNGSKKQIDDDLMGEIMDAAHKIYRKDFGNELLRQTTYYFNRFLRALVSSIVTIILTVAYFLYYYGLLTQVLYLYYIFGLYFVWMTTSIVRSAYMHARKYYCAREAFLQLSEQPTFENCFAIEEDLEEKGISI